MNLLPPKLEALLRRTRYYRFLRYGEPEPDAQACHAFLRPGDTVFDIGANIGNYTKVFSDCVGPSGSVHALEPVPETFGYLQHNVHKLRLNNVTLHQVAAGSHSAVARMSVPLWHGGRRNIYESRLDANGEHEVQVVTLDELFPGVHPALIKIDVEGHESAVLRGAANLLRSCQPILLVEVTSPETVTLLADLGYTKLRDGHGPNCFFSKQP